MFCVSHSEVPKSLLPKCSSTWVGVYQKFLGEFSQMFIIIALSVSFLFCEDTKNLSAWNGECCNMTVRNNLKDTCSCLGSWLHVVFWFMCKYSKRFHDSYVFYGCFDRLGILSDKLTFPLTRGLLLFTVNIDLPCWELCSDKKMFMICLKTLNLTFSNFSKN